MLAVQPEIEAKFKSARPLPRAALRAALQRLSRAVGPTDRHECRDLYLDTDDLWLLRAGVACRLRLRKDRAELVLKTLAPPRHGIARRLECEERLAPASFRFPGRLPGRTLRAWLEPLMGRQPVRVLFSLHQVRETCLVRPRAGVAFQVSADVATVEGASPAAVRRELEVELVEGRPEDLRPFAGPLTRALRLRPCRDSKFEFGLAAAGIALPALQEGGALRLRATDSLSTAAARVVARHSRCLLWNEPGVRLGLDPEKLHDMRVATRRLRAALRVFEGAWPAATAERLRYDLCWLGRGLGRVRDLDVHLDTLAEDVGELAPELRPALAGYLRQLGHERDHARAQMLRLLRSRRYAAFRRELETRFAAPPARADRVASEPVTELAPAWIRRALRRVLKAGRRIDAHAPPEDLHRLRIRCKRLRYVCEFLTDLYGKPARRTARAAAGLQDILGAHQDATVAQRLIDAYVNRPPDRRPCPAKQHFALGQLLAWKLAHARHSRDAFAKAWTRFDRRKLRQPLLRRLGQNGSHSGSPVR
jgi:CHAD domain-containing protein